MWLTRAGRSTFGSWGDSLWWALTTLTTVGYGDHMPVTTAGRLVAAAVMIAGVAVLGGVAALVALTLLRCGRKGLA
jgi:voltage-gated potassium channel